MIPADLIPTILATAYNVVVTLAAGALVIGLFFAWALFLGDDVTL